MKLKTWQERREQRLKAKGASGGGQQRKQVQQEREFNVKRNEEVDISLQFEEKKIEREESSLVEPDEAPLSPPPEVPQPSSALLSQEEEQQAMRKIGRTDVP